MASTPSTQADPQSDPYTQIEVVRDPDGPVAVVTERKKDGRITFSLSKEFDRNGKVERTPYFHRSHIPALRRLIDDLEAQLELFEDRARARRRAS